MATYSEVSDLILSLLPTGQNITASDHRTVEQAILDFAKNQWLTGDIKEIDCTNQYITDNFESNGMGKNEREGWAICNGNNGTRNRNGRVSVAYGTSFPSVGTTMNAPVLGGSSTHTLQKTELPTIDVNLPGQWGGDDNNHSNQTRLAAGDKGPSETGFNFNLPFNVNNGGGAHNNMQPYIVTLFIQKL